jgi:hypothetical protein
MTERLQQPPSSRRRTTRVRPGRTRGAPAVPPTEPRAASTGSGPTILGFPAEVMEDTGDTLLPPTGTGPARPPASPALDVVRRPDPVAAGALVLAGVAANVGLSLSWSPGEGSTGLSLVQRGGEALDDGIAASVRSGVWEPLVVVLCGGLLVLLGFLLLVPARAHRALGVLALVVSLAAAAAVIALVSDLGWQTDRFGPGMWCAVAVPALGLFGALKAMLTAPRVTLAPAAPVRPPTVS